MSKRISVVLLAVFLMAISFIYIMINAKTYTASFNIGTNVDSIESVNIELENDKIVNIIDKKLEDGIFEVKFKSLNKGSTGFSISVENIEFETYGIIYVHNLGIISYGSYFGYSNGSNIIQVSLSILIAYILILLIQEYRKSVKENIYQYKNILYLGLIVFLFFSFINLVTMILLKKTLALDQTLGEIINLCSRFSFFLLPVAFLTSFLVIISNIVLIIKEGFHLRNLLGATMGIVFCMSVFLPKIVNDYFQKSTWIDVHNQNGIAGYVVDFFIVSIYICVSYLQCIFLGTIVISIKSAKHIPEFNKDFMVVLGCKIKNDGSLTKLLKSRVDKAIEFSKMQKEKNDKDLIFVLSGGKGKNELISEATAMKNYLLQNKINDENILIEDKAKNTFENIKFSNNIIERKMKDAKIAFSTTNYHVFRAGVLATKQNLLLEGIGAKTKSYFWINAFFREFIATLYTERKKHFSIVCILWITSIIMMVLLYISNNITLILN